MPPRPSPARSTDTPPLRLRWRWIAACLVVGAALGYGSRRLERPAAAPASPPRPSDRVGSAPVTPAIPGAGITAGPGADPEAWLDPADPRFDPLLGIAYHQLDTFEQFEREPRTPRFAERRERFLSTTVVPALERLVPGAQVDEIECRSGTCLVTVRLPDDDWGRRAIQYLPWGDSREIRQVATGDGSTGYQIASSNRRESLDHDTFERNVTGWLARVEPGLIELRDQRHAGADGGVGEPR